MLDWNVTYDCSRRARKLSHRKEWLWEGVLMIEELEGESAFTLPVKCSFPVCLLSTKSSRDRGSTLQRSSSDTDKHGRPGEGRGQDNGAKKAEKNAGDGSTRSTFIRMATMGYQFHYVLLTQSVLLTWINSCRRPRRNQEDGDRKRGRRGSKEAKRPGEAKVRLIERSMMRHHIS